MFPYGETVTRLRGTPEADPYSGEDTSLDWSDPDSLDISDCAFDPGASTEPMAADRDSVITQPVVYAPYAADIAARDRLVVHGRTWDVDGDPAPYRNPFTSWEAGMVVKLKAVAG